MSINKKAPMKKKWPRYCFYAAAALVLLAIMMYLGYCIYINSEYSYARKHFGETFEELYSLSYHDSDITDPIVDLGENALQTIGGGKTFGKLSRYCVEPEFYPDVVRVESEIDVVAGKTKETDGYLWIAYYQHAFDADGNCVTGSGTEDDRVLARWSLEKIDGEWTVTVIDEAP